MEESSMGLLLSERSREKVTESIKFHDELISDLKNMDISMSEILARFSKKIGKSAVEVEQDLRNLFADQFQEIIIIAKSLLGEDAEEFI